MRTRYYAFYPRNFGNEYTTIKVTTEQGLKMLEDFENTIDFSKSSLKRITLKELRRMASDEKWRNKNDYSFSGYADYEPISVGEFLRNDED